SVAVLFKPNFKSFLTTEAWHSFFITANHIVKQSLLLMFWALYNQMSNGSEPRLTLDIYGEPA
ncbi:hypothetical protein M9458_029136, partial [Cirrhinus mrigala]